jgi:hypothetical protein
MAGKEDAKPDASSDRGTAQKHGHTADSKPASDKDNQGESGGATKDTGTQTGGSEGKK